MMDMTEDLVDDGELEEVEEALRRQDEAMALLERLRLSEPVLKKEQETAGGGRREGRRWPMPEGVTLELHDSDGWRKAECSDLGIGGAKLSVLPAWVNGPVPARLKTPAGPAVLVLADLMWRDSGAAKGGLRFEFLSQEERELWADQLIDALLARYSLA
ncbi:hypothetical protein CCAX7_009790 [Capsulimonas corticalis]|uniref:Uncharacterized protein n=1 Tax=Capsulimonas corticalis TaxID=2219043 RepID=A0A402CUB2_9BACT|nr:PilZ domain-containing protein [Capsulimonas corticalis]BDI28928.1 hypothetical protein CCAX7_009790 [Capsulimonas corticalis]